MCDVACPFGAEACTFHCIGWRQPSNISTVSETQISKPSPTNVELGSLCIRWTWFPANAGSDVQEAMCRKRSARSDLHRKRCVQEAMCRKRSAGSDVQERLCKKQSAQEAMCAGGNVQESRKVLPVRIPRGATRAFRVARVHLRVELRVDLREDCEHNRASQFNSCSLISTSQPCAFVHASTIVGCVTRHIPPSAPAVCLCPKAFPHTPMGCTALHVSSYVMRHTVHVTRKHHL